MARERPTVSAHGTLGTLFHDAEEPRASDREIAWYWETYRAEADARRPELSPLFATTLSELPPAVIAVATADVLRDEGLDYARSLEDARQAAPRPSFFARTSPRSICRFATRRRSSRGERFSS